MPLNPIKYLRKINWRLVVAGLCAIGVLHILAVLSEPRLARSHAYARLAPTLPLNKMVVLPQTTAEAQPLPFMAPDARYAMCRFTTENGPVAVKAVLHGAGWLTAVYNENGESLNTTVAVPDRKTTIVSLRLMPSDKRFMGLTPQARGEAGENTIALPVGARRGLVVVRAPEKGLAFQDQQEAALLQASCRQLRSR